MSAPVALITAASKGMGAACARELALSDAAWHAGRNLLLLNTGRTRSV